MKRSWREFSLLGRFGLAAIIASFVWAWFAPSFVDDNTTVGIWLHLGGMLLIMVIGLAMMVYRDMDFAVRIIRPGMREPEE